MSQRTSIVDFFFLLMFFLVWDLFPFPHCISCRTPFSISFHNIRFYIQAVNVT